MAPRTLMPPTTLPTLLHLDNRWQLFDGNRCREFSQAPDQLPALRMITDFTGSVAGLASFEGRTDHAAALVEQQLRRAGLTDGESKVLLHRSGRLGQGFQVLYTAVAIEPWQQLLGWVQRHTDHCLLLPALAVLAQGLPSGQARLLRAGRRLTVLARQGRRLAHAEVLAFSEDDSDLASATGTLAERLLAQCGADAGTLQLEWYCASTGDAEQEARLARLFADTSGIATALAPMQRYTRHAEAMPDAAPYCFSAVAALAALSRPRHALNRWPDRLAWQAEWALPALAAATVLMTVAMWLASGHLLYQRHHLHQQAAALHDSLHTLQGTLPAAQPLPAPPELAATRALIRQLHELAGDDNPASDLLRLQGAVDEDIRILRVRSEPRGGRGSALRVEGVASGAGAQLPRFVDRLRALGYSAQAVDPGNSAGQPTGYFAYRLTRTDSPVERVALGEVRR